MWSLTLTDIVQFPAEWIGSSVYYVSGTTIEGINIFRASIDPKTRAITGPALAITTGPGMKLYPSVLPDGRVFCFQKQYMEFWKESRFLGSYSRPVKPDLSLEVGTAPETRVIVLDAKYRIDAQLNDAIASIHMYRDAMVQGSAGGIEERRNIVSGAYLLTPYLPAPADGRDWKETSMPGRLFHPPGGILQ